MILKSLAKWKRDAEAWYRHDTATLEGFFLQAKVDDHQSVAATLIREVERNKLSSRYILLVLLYIERVDVRITRPEPPSHVRH
jgi:hypothetical protein